MLEEPKVPGENTIMTTTHAGVVLRHIRGLAAGGPAAQLADKQLLERFKTAHDAAALEAAARADEKIAGYLDGATVRRVVAVPGRLVNFVLG